MRRNVFSRAMRTAWQTALPAFATAVAAGIQSGDYGTGMWIAALVAASATGLSAAQNVLENRHREGPTED